MSMYIRIKRQKLTVFLQVEPSDTVLEVKQKLQALVEQPPDKVQLCKGSSPLEDAKRLSELKIENDDIIGMCFVQPDGAFEDVVITPFDGARDPAT